MSKVVRGPIFYLWHQRSPFMWGTFPAWQGYEVWLDINQVGAEILREHQGDVAHRDLDSVSGME